MWISVGPSTEEWVIYLRPCLQRKISVPPPADTNCQYFLKLGFDSPIPLHTGIFSDFNLSSLFGLSWCVNQLYHVQKTALLSWLSFLTSDSYALSTHSSSMFHEPWLGRLIQMIHPQLGTHTHLFLALWPALSLCIYYYQPNATSLTRFESICVWV